MFSFGIIILKSIMRLVEMNTKIQMETFMRFTKQGFNIDLNEM